MNVLETRALNRATLARQLLLERADVPMVDAVAHLCGMQAQEPQEPFVGLWSRLSAFDPEVLSDLLVGRRVVRTHLMRRTIHLVTAEDALAWRARHDTMLRQRVLGTYRRELDGVDLDELSAAALEIMSDDEPHTMAEIARALAVRWPAPDVRALGEMVVAALIPMVQLPPRGMWRTKAGVRNVRLSAWLGREIDPPPPDRSDPAGRALVRRYLAAFGPATSADLRAWSGLQGLPAPRPRQTHPDRVQTAPHTSRNRGLKFTSLESTELGAVPTFPKPENHGSSSASKSKHRSSQCSTSGFCFPAMRSSDASYR